MEVTFGEAQLAALCNSERRMVRRWGHEGFQYVGRRLFELAAVADLEHVAALPGAELSRDGKGQVTITFDRGRLVVDAHLVERSNTEGAKMHLDVLHVLALQVRQIERTR